MRIDIGIVRMAVIVGRVANSVLLFLPVVHDSENIEDASVGESKESELGSRLNLYERCGRQRT